MIIQKIYDEQSGYALSPEFSKTLADIKPDVEAMVSADKQMKHHRMKVIGQLVEHRTNTVNPDDRKTIRQMLSTWSQDVVDNASAAYRCYKDLKGNVNKEFQKLADTATPTQLMLIGRGEGTGLAYDAAMALRRNGKVPTQQQLRGHLGGFMDSKFNQKYRTNTVIPEARQSSQSSSQQTSTYVTPQMSEEERLRQAQMKRMGLDEPSFQHLETLVSRKNLPFINDIQTAQVWSGGSEEQINRCLNVIEQKLSQQTKSGCHIELRLREMLARHSKRVEALIVEADDLLDTGEDLSIPQAMLSLEGKRRRAMRLLGR